MPEIFLESIEKVLAEKTDFDWNTFWDELKGEVVQHLHYGDGIVAYASPQHVGLSFATGTRIFQCTSLFRFLKFPINLDQSHCYFKFRLDAVTSCKTRQKVDANRKKLDIEFHFYEINWAAVDSADLSETEKIIRSLSAHPNDIPGNVLNWLQAADLLFVCAIFFEQKFYRNGRASDAIRAAAAWRRAGDPERNIKIIEYLLSAFPDLNQGTQSAALTTKAAAFADLNEYFAARQSIDLAIRVGDSKQARLAALRIYRALELDNEADQHLERAEELGAFPHELAPINRDLPRATSKKRLKVHSQ